MNRFYMMGRISSTAWKAFISGNQMSKSRGCLTVCASYYHFGKINNNLEPQFHEKKFHMPIKLFCLSGKRELSTTSCKLSAHKGHDHSWIWNFERILSLLMLPVVPAALFNSSPQMDTVLALLIVMHTHFGLEAILVDYIRPILFGDMAPKIAIALLYVFSILTLAGLLNLIYNDCGLANTIINIWKK